MQDGKHGGAGHREERHGLGEPVDRGRASVGAGRSRIAEINVPAWPMPIHQTKLTMAKPQATGMFTPQMPMPRSEEPADRGAEEADERKTPRRSRATRNPGNGRSSGSRLIVCRDRRGRLPEPPGAGRAGRGGSAFMRAPAGVRRTPGQVGRARPGIERLEQRCSRRLAPSVARTRLAGPRGRQRRSPRPDRPAGRPSRSRRRGRRGFRFSAAIRGRVDPLHAVGALLHHPAATDGHVRGSSRRLGRCLALRPVVEEIKPADLVGAVVGAVARADAAIVDHVVQSLAAVHGGSDRADDLARRILAVHARHRLVEDSAGTLGARPRSTWSIRIHCISRPRATWSFPTTGILFSAWHATTQALQPRQVLKSMLMPQAYSPRPHSLYSVAGAPPGRRGSPQVRRARPCEPGPGPPACKVMLGR